MFLCFHIIAIVWKNYNINERFGFRCMNYNYYTLLYKNCINANVLILLLYFILNICLNWSFKIILWFINSACLHNYKWGSTIGYNIYFIMYKIPTSIVVCICSILYLNQQREYKSTINLKLLYLQVCKRNTTFARKLDIKRLILTFIYSNLLHCTK